MPTLETFRKHAKLLVRWHRDGNPSVGGKLRLLHRYRHLTDREALDMPLPLTLAQEVAAVEAGFRDWTALKAATDGLAPAPVVDRDSARLKSVTPILFVRDVSASADWYRDRLGFAVDFLHGSPPFYGSVSRDGVRLHLRFVARPNFAELAARETSLILATIETGNVKALFGAFAANGVVFVQGLVKQAWGGTDFQVADPDGNRISFVQYRSPSPA